LGAVDSNWTDGLPIVCDVPLAPFTTWGIGGPAEYLLEPGSDQELVRAVGAAREAGVEVHVIGRGSNLLVADEGVPGLVIALRRCLDSLTIDPESGHVVAGAGTPAQRIAVRAAKDGVSGFEFLIAIPGALGGAVIMNAGLGGRDGRSVRDVLANVRVVTADGRVASHSGAASGLRYRGSAIGDRGEIVLSAELQGSPGTDPMALLAEHALIRQRRAKRQPKNRRTSGSVFKQPPNHPPAGWLLDQAGLKGTRVGDAMISLAHANWIENLGSATAHDVLSLMDLARDAVLARFGVILEPEVHMMPRTTSPHGNG